MILHILIDDKFSDYVINQFSGFEMNSEFVIISYSDKFNYFHYPEVAKYVNPNISNIWESFLVSLTDYSAVIFHGLFDYWCKTIIDTIPTSTKIAWVFWGGEVYGRSDLRNSFLDNWSKVLLYLKNIKEGKLTNEKNVIPIETFRRVDYCLTDMFEEFLFAKEYINSSELQHIWYNYYSISKTIGELKDSVCNGNNIIVGNSATIECNHIGVFIKLKWFNLLNRKIVVPLGYGSIWYKIFIRKIGSFLFNKSFLPITDYLSLEEYNNLLLSCSIMIQPHIRPQAQGNIITGLWLGMRVYLREDNMAYKYFKRLGIIIFSIEKDLNKKNSKVLESLSIKEIIHNREILSQWYDKDAMYNRNLELVKILS